MTSTYFGARPADETTAATREPEVERAHASLGRLRHVVPTEEIRAALLGCARRQAAVRVARERIAGADRDLVAARAAVLAGDDTGAAVEAVHRAVTGRLVAGQVLAELDTIAAPPVPPVPPEDIGRAGGVLRAALVRREPALPSLAGLPPGWCSADGSTTQPLPRRVGDAERAAYVAERQARDEAWAAYRSLTDRLWTEWRAVERGRVGAQNALAVLDGIHEQGGELARLAEAVRALPAGETPWRPTGLATTT
jgi:hypothetical protein